MKDFKSGGFRGGDRESGRGGYANKASYGDRGDRPSYTKKPWDKGAKKFGDDKPMFSATCGSCGKPCQVPFRPVDGRPVFCQDCFMSNKPEAGYVKKDFGGDRGDFNRAPKPSFNQGSAGGETYRAPKPDPRIDALVKQMESMNVKLDKLVNAMAGTKSKSEAKSETVADVIAAATASEKAPKKSFKMAKPVSSKKAPAKKKTAKKK